MKECESCGSEVKKLNKVERNYPPAEIGMCDVCFSTQCGNLGLYPNNVVDEHTLLRVMAQCTNMILGAMAKKK
jgi:hypothetical protein